MPRPTSIVKLVRVRLLPKDGGGTLFFRIGAGRRPRFLRPSEAPDFEGDEAWFEVERVRGPVWMTYRVIRRVER